MAMYPLILICDDDPVVHESLGLYLSSEGYEHQSAYDGQQALEMVESLHPDMVVLDLMMPRMSGIDVCRTIRQTSSIPIIMLTAKGEEIDRIPRSGTGRGRLHRQAFQPPRGAGPHQGGAAALLGKDAG